MKWTYEKAGVSRAADDWVKLVKRPPLLPKTVAWSQALAVSVAYTT